MWCEIDNTLRVSTPNQRAPQGTQGYIVTAKSTVHNEREVLENKFQKRYKTEKAIYWVICD